MFSSSLDDEQFARTTYRRIRRTWMLMLASTIPLYTLPYVFQWFHDCFWKYRRPDSVFMGNAPATLYEWVFYWLPYWAAHSCVALILAAVVPWWLHRRWLSRLDLRLIESARGLVATYRDAPRRQFVMQPRDIHRLACAYGVRLAAVAFLLIVGVVFAIAIAYPAISWGSVTPSSIHFSAVETYLPLFISATLILLWNAPTKARLFGPYRDKVP